MGNRERFLICDHFQRTTDRFQCSKDVAVKTKTLLALVSRGCKITDERDEGGFFRISKDRWGVAVINAISFGWIPAEAKILLSMCFLKPIQAHFFLHFLSIYFSVVSIFSMSLVLLVINKTPTLIEIQRKWLCIVNRRFRIIYNFRRF